MELVLDNLFLGVIFAFLILFWCLYRQLTRSYDYWVKRGVPQARPYFPFGSFKGPVLGQTNIGEAYAKVYNQFPEERFCGVVAFNHPVLVLRDPDLIKHVLVKDFSHFINRVFDVNPQDFLSTHLFALDGEKWRTMRNKLSPAFSSGKMKNMFLLMVKCSDQLRDCLDRTIQTQSSINVKEMLAKFTMDIIATCAFGLETNSLQDEHNKFYQTGTSIFKPSFKVFINRRIFYLLPFVAKALKLEIGFPNHVRSMLLNMVTGTVKYREENNVSRGDFMDILIKLKQNKNISDDSEVKAVEQDSKTRNQTEGLSLHEMTAQAFIFFAAGFETASSTLTFCLYELAQHVDVQERLSREVQNIVREHGGQITYQALQEMKYMDQVINETLRMYASLPILNRRCSKLYQIPDSDLVLEEGQRIVIPTYAIHHDPQYYPDPHRFDPERFTPEQVQARHSCLHLPFGTGPRNCIGMRFGLMQTKVGLATVLQRFKVDVSPETPIPIEIEPISFVTQPKRPVLLKFTRR